MLWLLLCLWGICFRRGLAARFSQALRRATVRQNQKRNKSISFLRKLRTD